MKAVIFAAVVLVSGIASAFEIQGARLNTEKQAIELDVVYSGGCQKHDFVLNLNTCTRAIPTACVAQVEDVGAPDSCRAIIKETVLIPAQRYLQNVNLHQLVILDEQKNPVLIDFSSVR